jgi:signal transduction histidine kinase
MLSDIRGEAERLARLVGELLLLARADAGQPLGRDRVALDDVLVETVRGARPLADGVELGIAALEPATVLGDRDRLKQLLLILVENALRYTPRGGRARVALRRRDGRAELEVADTGIGIAAADLPRVFDRFYRGDEARSRDAGGSGLGLAIARWIAEAHGGRIAVESRPGEGTTFTVSLPLAAEAAPGAAAQDGAVPRAEPAGAAAD